MSNRKTMTALALMAIGMAVLAPGCGTVEAKPLDVTYYYLPG